MNNTRPLALFSRPAVAVLYAAVLTPEGVCRICGGADEASHDAQCPLSVLEYLRVRAVLTGDVDGDRREVESDTLEDLGALLGSSARYEHDELVAVEFVYKLGDHLHPAEREVETLRATARTHRLAAEAEAARPAREAAQARALKARRAAYLAATNALRAEYDLGDLTESGYNRRVSALATQYADVSGTR